MEILGSAAFYGLQKKSRVTIGRRLPMIIKPKEMPLNLKRLATQFQIREERIIPRNCKSKKSPI
jgi:hypothetical protein